MEPAENNDDIVTMVDILNEEKGKKLKKICYEKEEK